MTENNKINTNFTEEGFQERVVQGSELRVTNVTNVTNVTLENEENNSKVTKVTRNQTIQQGLLGFSIIDKLMRTLYYNPGKSYKELAEILNEPESNVKATMNKDKDFFAEINKDGKTKYWDLSDLGVMYLHDLAKKKKEIDKQITYKLEKDKAEEEKIFNLKEEGRVVLDQVKKERIGNSVYIDFYDIAALSHSFADMLLDNPEDTFAIMNTYFEYEEVEFRIKNIPSTSTVSIENLRDKHINKLICIEGRSVSMSSVMPQVVNAKFECPNCGSVISVLQPDINFREPKRCSCGRKGGFKLLSEMLNNISRIVLEDLQEKTDNPHTQRLTCLVKNELTNSENIKIFSPGNEIKMIGILKKVPITKNGTKLTIYSYQFDVVYAELSEKDIDIENFSQEDKIAIKELSDKIDKHGLLEIIESFAPEVHGYEHIKEALALQICNRRNRDNGEGIRNKSNILLIGDPGVSKSVLGNFVHKIIPGSRKAVGGGSSAVGITASVIKEDESIGGFRVEPGALVLAKDILFLDELNNLSDEDKPKLQEGMSESSVTVNKASLHVRLKVTAGILATANPKNGIFNREANYSEQFNIPTPIINRFDLIFIISDETNEKKDMCIAEKMIQRERKFIKPKYSIDFLKKFFVYIKNLPEPEIDDKATDLIKEVYKNARKYKTQHLLINPRFIEALIRLVKASAKIRQSSRVERKDISRAINILKKSHYNFEETTSKGIMNGLPCLDIKEFSDEEFNQEMECIGVKKWDGVERRKSQQPFHGPDRRKN